MQRDSDEIDLVELAKKLYKKKHIIIISSALCAVIAVVLHAIIPKKWESISKIQEPNFSDYSDLYNIGISYQPLDGSDYLLTLANPKNLFGKFSQNLGFYKKEFINSHPYYQDKIKNLGFLKKEEKLKSFTKKITINTKKIKTNNDKDDNYISLNVVSKSPETSQKLNLDYLNFTQGNITNYILKDLQAIKEASLISLEKEIKFEKEKATSVLEIEKKKIIFSLNIAKKAGVVRPLSYLGRDQIFQYYHGTKPLEGLLSAYEKADLRTISSHLNYLTVKQVALKNLKIPKDLSFSSYSFIEKANVPLSPSGFNLLLITVLGSMLGMMLGTFYVLLKINS
jgi:LPS O-antigen subunit length determinant protein (WzzB/FepE family)